MPRCAALTQKQEEQGAEASSRHFLRPSDPGVTQECEVLGKRLKRDNVAIDIINYSQPENIPKLEALVNMCNSGGNSHFCNVDPNAGMISEVLFGSPILNQFGDDPMAGGNEGAPVQPAGPGRFAEYGGVDPSLDPELAQALKLSLEEQKANEPQPAPAEEAKKDDVDMDQPKPTPQAPAEEEEEHDEEYFLRQAIEMSMMPNEPKPEAKQEK